jgi:hypothetical protein
MENAEMIVALLVLVVLTAKASRAVGGSTRGAWLTLVCALAWQLLNKPLEGPVLVVVMRGHGIAFADLLCAVAAALAVWSLGRRRPSPERAADPTAMLVDTAASAGHSR